MNINKSLPTPYYLIDEGKLLHNLAIIDDIRVRSGAKILLAQKAFSSFYFYPLLSKHLDGTTASGLYEARLGYEEFGKEVHVFAPAFKDDDFNELMKYAGHIVFNSKAQLMKYKDIALRLGKTIGVRINPEISTQTHEMYDPCSPNSRMGIKISDFDKDILDNITGLHFHTLCQQNADALEITLKEVEAKFGKYFSKLKWLNFGGGHHITRSDYDVERLINIIRSYKEKYHLDIYLEPGEGIVLNAGYLVSTILDIVHNGIDIAILDTSATCHMPDVLEMPFTPPVVGTNPTGKYLYRFAGNTCLSGDNIGQYRFDKPLSVGDMVVFLDMALYTIVKNTTFNGIPLPSIYALKTDGSYELVKKFGYLDFKGRLS